MSVKCYTLLCLFLTLGGAMAATAAHSPHIRRGFRMVESLPTVTEQRSLSKRSLEHPPAPPTPDTDPQGIQGNAANVTGHPLNKDLVTETDDDFTTDYDFVLDLDEQEDFDRLLNMLSRSGPAKPQHEGTAGSSSTFLDRHDELVHPSPAPHSSLAAPFLPHGTKYTPQKVDPHTEGSHFDDLEQAKKDEEQRRLEELYFNQVQKKRESSSEEENDSWQGVLYSSTRSLEVRTPIVVSLSVAAMLICLL